MEITKGQAREFYRDLCGTYNGNTNKTCQCIVTIPHIAETMNIPETKANEFCSAMIRYGITERQGNGIVI